MAKHKMIVPLTILLQRNTMVLRHEELEVAIPEEVGKARAGVSIIYLDHQVSHSRKRSQEKR